MKFESPMNGTTDSVILSIINSNAVWDYDKMNDRFKQMVSIDSKFMALFVQMSL